MKSWDAQKVRVLFFDLDDTLISSERAYSAALLSVGIDPRGSGYLQARAKVKERLGETHVSSKNRLLYFKRYLETLSQFSASRCLELTKAYEEAMIHEMAMQWKTLHRDDLLRELSAKYSLALVTNETVRTQLIKLQVIDPHGRFFSHVIISEELGVEKPSPSIFQEALDRVQCAPSEACMIGDRVRVDLEPANGLGMQTVLTREFVNWPQNSDPSPCVNRVVSKLDDLRDILL